MPSLNTGRRVQGKCRAPANLYPWGKNIQEIIAAKYLIIDNL